MAAQEKITLQALVDSVIEDLIDNADNEDRAQDLLPEFVDSAMPVYYNEQFDLLEDDDVFTTDLSELAHGMKEMTLQKLLPLAIFMAIEAAVQQRWDEVVIGIAEKSGTPVEE